MNKRGEKEEKEKKTESKNNKIKFLTQLITGRVKTKWSKTVGEYSMGFKVQTSSEQIGVVLGKYGNNCDISPNEPLFIKGEK